MEEKRKRAVIADDEEDEEQEEQVVVDVDNENNNDGQDDEQEEQQIEKDEADGMDDLFGDDGEDDEDQADARAADSDGIVHDSNDEDEDGNNNDQFLVHQEEVTRELRVGEEDIIRHPPKFDGKDGDIYTAKIPKFLHVNPSRFDGTDHLKQLEQLFKSDVSKEEIELKTLQDENTIRWRFTKQSNESLTAESNAQIVEWEDGSFSLKLGEEYFDVLQSSLSDTYLVRCEGESVGERDETKPVVFVSDGIVKKTMKFVPTSTNSKIHQKLTTAIRSRQQTKATTQSVVVEIDPSLESKRLEKEQEDRLREKRRELQRLERDQERLGSAGPGATQRDTYGSRERTSYTRVHDEYEDEDGFIDDEEEEDDEDDDDVMEDVDEDIENADNDDDDDQDDLAAERLKRVKEDGAAKYQQDRESEDVQTRKKRRVIEDDEDDD